ncbi:MAG: hypothetical protein ACR2N2_02415, partial [Acidimicrobiia bacterium]
MFTTDLEQAHWAQLNTELIESMNPGPHLAAYLEGVDVTEIRAASRIDVLRAELRMASAYRGRMYRTMASIASVLEDPDLRDHDIEAYEMAAAEVRTALRLTKHTANTEMALALRLSRHLP